MVRQMISLSRLPRRWTVTLAFFGPLVLVGLIALLMPSILPEGATAPNPLYQDDAPQVFDNLASDMSAMAIGLMAVSALLLRQRLRKFAQKGGIAFFIVVIAFSVSSIYVGLRLRYEAAVLATKAEYDFSILGDAYRFQAFLLLLAAMTLCSQAAHFIEYREEG